MQNRFSSIGLAAVGLVVLSTSSALAGLSCTVKIAVPEAAELSALEVDVDYSATSGTFQGLGEAVSCSIPFDINSANDDDGSKVLHLSGADTGFVGAPGYVATCTFATGMPVDAADFAVTVVDDLTNDDDGLFGSGVCGSPYSGSTPPHARDAMTVLRRSIALNACPLCQCDVNNSGNIESGDALNVLRASAEVPLSFNCGAPCGAMPGGTGPGTSVTAAAQVLCNGVGCGNGTVDPGEECDDGNANDTDGCSLTCESPCQATPRGTCRAAGASKLLIKGNGSGDKDKLVWSWLKGPEIGIGDLSNPTTGSTYRLCLYPDGSLLSTIDLPQASWSSNGDKGYKFQDKSSATGVAGAQVSTGGEGKSKLKVKGSGAALPLMLLPASNYTLQMIDVASGNCWSSSFPAPTWNGNEIFKAKTP